MSTFLGSRTSSVGIRLFVQARNLCEKYIQILLSLPLKHLESLDQIQQVFILLIDKHNLIFHVLLQTLNLVHLEFFDFHLVHKFCHFAFYFGTLFAFMWLILVFVYRCIRLFNVSDKWFSLFLYSKTFGSMYVTFTSRTANTKVS